MREKGDHVTIISLPQRLDLFGLAPGMDLAPRAEEEASMSSTPQTHVTHNSYTVEFKLQVLDWYHNNGKNKNAAAKQFGVDRKRIRDWEMNEQLLREQTDVHRKRQRFTGGPGRRLISVDLDKALIEWYKEQIAQQRHVFNRHIKTKALEVAQQLGLRESFKASDMWVVGWKKRHKAELGLDKSEGDSLTSTPQSQKTHNVSISAPGDYEEQLREEAISELLRLGSSDDVDETGGQLEDSSGDMEHIQNSVLEIDPKAVQTTASMTPHHVTLSLWEDGTRKAAHSSLSEERHAISNGEKTRMSVVTGRVLPTHDVMSEQKLKEQEQQISLIEQTVESLERDFSARIAQLKLELQLLRTTVMLNRDQLFGSSSPAINSSLIKSKGPSKR